MPVCSMLYQLASKCNDKLKPSITYYNSNNHAQEESGDDGCSFIKTLNADRPSWLAQLTGNSAKAPQTLILLSLVMVFCVAAGFLFMSHNGVEPSRIFDDMSTVGTTSTAFDYESVVSTFHRFDSGIGRIRQQSVVQPRTPSRARTAPSGVGRKRALRQQLGAWEEEEDEEDMEQWRASDALGAMYRKGPNQSAEDNWSQIPKGAKAVSLWNAQTLPGYDTNAFQKALVKFEAWRITDLPVFANSNRRCMSLRQELHFPRYI